MILVSIHEIRSATAAEYDDFAAVHCNTRDGQVTLYLPIGTSEAVAACINVAVAAGAQAEKAKMIAALTAKWNGICEAMNKGTWHGSEADALAQIDSIKAQIAKLEAAE